VDAYAKDVPVGLGEDVGGGAKEILEDGPGGRLVGEGVEQHRYHGGLGAIGDHAYGVEELSARGCQALELLLFGKLLPADVVLSSAPRFAQLPGLILELFGSPRAVRPCAAARRRSDRRSSCAIS
jgi:hypothetical protein